MQEGKIVRVVLYALCLCAILVSDVAAQPAAPESLPAPAADFKAENLAGGTKTLAECKGKVLLLMLVGRFSRDAAANVSNEIGLALTDQPDFLRVSVGDLKGAPGFLRGPIRSGIRDGFRKSEEKLKKEFEARMRPFEERHKPVVLLDWRGEIAKHLGVSGQTERTYQIFVVDRRGYITARFTQNQDGATDADLREKTLAALKKALAATQGERKQ